jgi:hypothetical protein
MDAYLAIRQRAVALRGLLETPSDWMSFPTCPCTTGADAIDIAAVFDPAIRACGTLGLQLRWESRMHELACDAILYERQTYPENRPFWSTVEAAAVQLDDICAPLPSEAVWNQLIAELGQLSAPRNAGPSTDGPFGHFDVKTYDELFTAQRTFLASKRGFDVHPPGTFKVPRTTNQDVLQLAAYWTDQLAKAKHASNYDAVAARWKTALADVDGHAKPGTPDDVYMKNDDLWHALLDVAVQVAIGDESPSEGSLVKESIEDSVKHLPETLEHAAKVGADLVGRAGHALGEAVGGTTRGFLSSLGVPILIGAGVLGFLLFTRKREHTDEA